MRVLIDRERCISSGTCVFHVPHVFDQSDEDGLAILSSGETSGEVEPDMEEEVKAAAARCPAEAIILSRQEAASSSDA